ncbi:uncharacterized protein LOC114320993 [Camellia sinensis]|uniref:uncharacterized protein LOC114320993 n=1 Tax=Camellia sinensis TaxID=4442 RepID=UPI001035E32D|nr:uncharacterized protein LOC114320993 [Camellia sinensis]
MGQLIQHINEHIRVEDDAAVSTAKTTSVATDKRSAGKVHAVGQETNRPNDRAEDSDRGSNRRNRERGRRNDRDEYPRDDVADANSDAQKGFNPRYRCTYHQEQGHQTEDCLPLKQHLEELVTAGHLDLYIDGGVKAAHPTPADQHGPDDLEALPQGVVNVIHGIVEPAHVCELRGMIKKAEHMREALSVQPVIKRGKTEEKDVISFSTRDLERIQTPHNDALVVTLRVKKFDVKRILIDQESSVEIMYYGTLKQLKL